MSRCCENKELLIKKLLFDIKQLKIRIKKDRNYFNSVIDLGVGEIKKLEKLVKFRGGEK